MKTQFPSRGKPDFVVVGTAKAGTTSLAHYLNGHPAISIPRKETFFFNSDAFASNCLPYPLQRLSSEVVYIQEDYHALYNKTKAAILGEVGTGYLYHYQEAIPKIKAVLGTQVPIFIVLRNPIDRAYSAYMHFKKDCFETGSFTEALELEGARINQHWDFMWHYKAMGFYYKQVKAYQQHFNRVQVCFFDDLQEDAKAFMEPIYDTLGLVSKNHHSSARKNPSGEPRFPWLQRFITHESPAKQVLRPLLRTFIGAEKRALLRKQLKAQNLKPSEQMAPETRRTLAQLYQKDVLQLSDLLEKDLTHWTDVA